MANKPSRPSTLTADAAEGGRSSAPKLLWLWVALGAVVALLAGFAILSSGDDEELTVGSTVPADGATSGTGPADGTDTTVSTGGDSGGTGQVAEAWPVTLEGALLPPLGDGDDPAVGTLAPTMSGFAFDGTPVTVDPSKGPVMLVFLAHWCPHCNREIPQLNAWRDVGDMPDDLQVVGVITAVDPNAENYPPSEWIPATEWTWPVIADSPEMDAASGFGVSGFPFAVIIDTDGTVLARWSGEVGQDGIDERVSAALG